MRGILSPSPGTADLEAARRVLRDRFGFPDFRPGQAGIVTAMLGGRDVLAVLPTGAGKSLCFQLPALLAPGPTLVVSPLIALMEDQVAGLRRRGIDAAALTSATPGPERDRLLGRFAVRPPRLLYVSPERLGTSAFAEAWGRLRPARLVVDEAHCISEWGHDFRPEYRRILRFLEAVGRPPVAAFTATATPATRDDVARCLALRAPHSVTAPVDRPNLRWSVRHDRAPGSAARRAEAAVQGALRADGDAAAVVYVLSRAGTARAAAALRRSGVAAGAYHGGMDPATRTELQEAFLRGPLRAMCATSAFGMGVDHPHVRLVCHLGMPASLEAYVQEAGRAGRDGRDAACLLLPLAGDERLHRSRIRAARRAAIRRGERSTGTRVAAASMRRLRAVRAYATTRGCRREAISRYFGETAGPCAGCDRCAGSVP